MYTHLTAAMAPVALSTQGLVTYLQGLFGPLFLGIVGIVAIFFLFTREITRFVQFMVLAVAIAVVFYTPSIVQTLATGIANALGVHWSRLTQKEGAGVDLPTYTNIWRIEKRLYKLYDFRLPAPLPITWIGVFVGITVPYVLFLIAVGLPFNHNLVWLYVLPPGVLTWLTTRPVIENKRLPELVSSQLRYITEPRTWCRMAPFSEKDEILVTARVWHQHPPKARPKKAKKAVVKARPTATAPQLAIPEAGEKASAGVRPVKVRRAVASALAARRTAPPPALSPAAPPTAPAASSAAP